MWHSLCLTVTEKFITWCLTLCIFFIKRKSEDERVTVAVITFRKFRPNIHGPREFFRTTEHWFHCISINIRFGFFVTRFYDSWIIHKDFNNFVESKIMKNRQFREIDIFGESTTTIRELWTTTLSDFLLFVPFQRPFQFSQTICPKSGYKMFYRLLTAPLIRDPWTVINPFYVSQFLSPFSLFWYILGSLASGPPLSVTQQSNRAKYVPVLPGSALQTLCTKENLRRSATCLDLVTVTRYHQLKFRIAQIFILITVLSPWTLPCLKNVLRQYLNILQSQRPASKSLCSLLSFPVSQFY